MQINPKSIKNILLVRNDRLGEFLLNIPAFKALKEHFSGSRLTIAVNPNLKELAERVDCVDEVITWESKKHKLREIVRFSRELKNKGIDLCMIFNPTQEFNIISFLAGIPVRMGYNRKLACLLTHKISDRKHIGDTHEIERNLKLAALTGAKADNPEFFLRVEDEVLPDEIKIACRSPLVAVHPWTSDAVKEWPVSNFCALAKRITSELNAKVVIIGARSERQKHINFLQDFDPDVIDIVDKTSLKQLAVVLKSCKLLISADSGPVHLACAVKTPVLAIFCNNIPGKTSKRWGPWGEGHIVIEKSNLCDITVNEVFDKVKEFLLGGAYK